MSQRGRGRGADKTYKLQELQSLDADIAKYCTSRPGKNTQRHMAQNITTTQRQNAPLQQHSQSPAASSLHASSSSSSSLSPAQSHKHMPPPSAPLQHKLISSHSPSPATKSFTRNSHSLSKTSPQHKQILSRSPSPATKSLTQNSHPLSKPSSQHKQMSSRSPSPPTKSFTRNSHSLSKPSLQHKQTLSRSPSPATKSFTRNSHPPSKPSPQHKQTLSQPPPSSVQRNRLSPARQGHKEEWTKDGETSCDIIRSVEMIVTQLNRMEERQILIEKKIDENVKAIKQLTRESAVRRPVKPQGVLFKTVDDFSAFEEVDDDIYNDLVGYFVYLGRTNPVDCAAEYFRSVFPEDEEVSTYLTLNERTGPGGCKLRDSRFAQACQDAINANKHFSNPNKVEFYDALEKALKSLKTRKWRYNRKRRLHQESEEENEEVPLNRRQRMNNPEEDTEFENIQEVAEDANEPEETQHTEGENADDMDTQDTQDTDGTEDNDEHEYLAENDLYDDESNDGITLFSSPPDFC
ncbi:uncharacterized protein [Temnothorax nylanderi]|uniref:uncharacterized protein n=1 Tax=Temnothorax nylanderi TaxID=102681 RepID=UPI003A8C1186